MFEGSCWTCLCFFLVVCVCCYVMLFMNLLVLQENCVSLSRVYEKKSVEEQTSCALDHPNSYVLKLQGWLHIRSSLGGKGRHDQQGN